MIIAVLFWIAISIIRGVVASTYDISELADSHIWFLLPDLLFFGFSIYWLFVQEKIKPNAYLVLYLLAFLGSIIWDYQWGYYGLKFLFPYLLFIILHREKVNLASIKDLVYTAITLLPPVFIFNALAHKKTQAESDEKIGRSAPWKAIIFGFIIGLAVMLLLSALDPEFAKFLKINDWLKYARSSLFSALYYLLAFGWFFWTPVRAVWKQEEERNHSLSWLLQVIAGVVTAVVIGYTLYDSYIILRALRVLSLTFESLGKNTQMSFLEMVFMTGGWLIAILYLAGKLSRHSENTSKKTRYYLGLLLVSLIWLIPPVANILRVLLIEYIPQYGLTSLRLFGLHTASAFIMAIAITAISLFLKSKNTLSTGALGFGLTLALFSFVVPNNLLMYDWHLKAFKEGKELDYRYLEGIRAEKWGHLVLSKLNTENQKESMIALGLAEQTKNEDLEEKIKKNLRARLDKEIAELKTLITEQNFAEIHKRHSDPSYWVYKGGPIQDLKVSIKETKEGPFVDELSRELK